MPSDDDASHTSHPGQEGMTADDDEEGDEGERSQVPLPESRDERTWSFSAKMTKQVETMKRQKR